MKNTQATKATKVVQHLKEEEERVAREPWTLPAVADALGSPHDTVAEALRKSLARWTSTDSGVPAQTLQRVVEAVERAAPQATAALRETQGARMALAKRLGRKSTDANAWLIDWLCKGTPDARSSAERLWTEQLRQALDANDIEGARDLLVSWAPTMEQAEQIRRVAIGTLWGRHPQAMARLAEMAMPTMGKLCHSGHQLTSGYSTLRATQSMLEIAILQLQAPLHDEMHGTALDTWWTEAARAMKILQTLERWPFTTTSIAHAWLEKGRVREMRILCAEAPEIIHSPLVAIRAAEKSPTLGAEWIRHAITTMTQETRTEWARRLSQKAEDDGRGLYHHAIEAGCMSLADAAHEAGVEPQAVEIEQAIRSIALWGPPRHDEIEVLYRTLERWPRLAHAQVLESLSASETLETLETLARDAYRDEAGIALARALANTGNTEKTTTLRTLVKRWGAVPRTLIEALLQKTDNRPGLWRQSDGRTEQTEQSERAIPTVSSLHDETVTIRFGTTHSETDGAIDPWRWHVGGDSLEKAMRDAEENAGNALTAWMAQGPPAVDPEDWRRLRETPVWTVAPGTNPAMLDAIDAGMKHWERANSKP